MSGGEKIEEETYSVIFSSLKHPIRRRILRMLVREPQAFSEILGSLSIDSGHLNYHLESLGDLIRRTSDGKYGLSSVGVAAVRLMSGVEEHPPTLRSSLGKTALDTAKRISLLLLILALIASSLFFTTYAQGAEDPYEKGYISYNVTIPPNQTFEYSIIIDYTEKPLRVGVGKTYFYQEKTPPEKGITSWERGSFAFTISVNETFTVNVTVLDPAGSLMYNGTWHMPDAGVHYVTYTEKPLAGAFRIGEFERDWLTITQSGSYKIKIKNIGSELISPTLKITVRWENFQRPYFYLGILELLLASIYPILILIRRILTKG